MKILKNPILTFIIGGILFSSITVFAVTTISADKITYTDKNNVERTVDKVLDDLYDKANSERVATQVATLTTQGASYTMQNDGYIVGTVKSQNHACNGVVYINDISTFQSPWDQDYENQSSIYVQKSSIIKTRSDCGIYNLTVYEWK